jgi:hypothetical protein
MSATMRPHTNNTTVDHPLASTTTNATAAAAAAATVTTAIVAAGSRQLWHGGKQASIHSATQWTVE